MSSPMHRSALEEGSSAGGQSRRAQVLRADWLGQMAASLFWAISVLTYGISSSGDWLQLLAALSWMVANVASVVRVEDA